MSQNGNIKLVEVFSGEQWQATMLQNVLIDSQIPAFLRNELMGQIEPWAVTAGGHQPVSVSVSSEDQEAALKLIEDFNNSEPLDETE
jgi:hypothetical protein